MKPLLARKEVIRVEPCSLLVCVCKLRYSRKRRKFNRNVPRIVPHNRRDSVCESALVQYTDMACTEAPKETMESILAVYLQYRLTRIDGHENNPRKPDNDSPDHCGAPRSPFSGRLKTRQERLHAVIGTSANKPRKRSLNQRKAETLVKARDASLLLFDTTDRV